MACYSVISRMMTASLIGRFEETLSQKAILAVFIPLIGGMAGNTGTQALAVAVRGIATGDLEHERKWKLVLREAGTGLITGFVCGVVVTLVVFIWQRSNPWMFSWNFYFYSINFCYSCRITRPTHYA